MTAKSHKMTSKQRLTIHVGFSESEYNEIVDALKDSGVSPSGFLKSAALASLNEVIATGKMPVRIKRMKAQDSDADARAAKSLADQLESEDKRSNAHKNAS